MLWFNLQYCTTVSQFSQWKCLNWGKCRHDKKCSDGRRNRSRAFCLLVIFHTVIRNAFLIKKKPGKMNGIGEMVKNFRALTVICLLVPCLYLWQGSSVCKKHHSGFLPNIIISCDLSAFLILLMWHFICMF